MRSCLEKAVESLMAHNHCQILTFNGFVKYGEVPTSSQVKDSLYMGEHVKWIADSTGGEFYEVWGRRFPASHKVNLVAGVLFNVIQGWER